MEQKEQEAIPHSFPNSSALAVVLYTVKMFYNFSFSSSTGPTEGIDPCYSFFLKIIFKIPVKLSSFYSVRYVFF